MYLYMFVILILGERESYEMYSGAEVNCGTTEWRGHCLTNAV